MFNSIVSVFLFLDVHPLFHFLKFIFQKMKGRTDKFRPKIFEKNHFLKFVLKEFFLIHFILFSIQGMDFIEKYNDSINIITNLHVHIKCAMTKQSILSVCKLVELMKITKITMKTFSTEIYNTILCFTQYQLYQVLHIIKNAKVKKELNTILTKI